MKLYMGSARTQLISFPEMIGKFQKRKGTKSHLAKTGGKTPSKNGHFSDFGGLGGTLASFANLTLSAVVNCGLTQAAPSSRVSHGTRYWLKVVPSTTTALPVCPVSDCIRHGRLSFLWGQAVFASIPTFLWPHSHWWYWIHCLFWIKFVLCLKKIQRKPHRQNPELSAWTV